MNCKNCGAPLTNQDRFCQNCGAQLNSQQQMPPAFNNQAYAQMPIQPKKKRTGLKVFLVLLLIAALGAVAFIIFKPNIKLFGPKNLGVKYTQVDYQNALAKTGININFNGMTQQQLEAFKDNNKNQDLNINDYTWSFDYEQRIFTLTPSEATALLNEIAPNFFWFDDIQVKINPDGTMEGSSTLN
ncbi:MAG TPA: zinc ribbon domain-containing protein, partial [Clostridia bacterium]|nr:zinc ribbon domain-containing protein [Clostridia bacterium]